MRLAGGVASHVGNVREVNQDRAFFGGFIAAVADGMGGHKGGEIAAQVALSGFDTVKRPIECDELLDLVSEANTAVFDKAIDPDLRGMGTTLVALALQPNDDVVNIANVGDSRAYHFSAGTLRQITVDHSLVQELITAGKITKEEAETHPQKNIVTRALGISPTVEPDYFTLPAQIGDRFLLCSDGLFNEVSEEQIAEVLEGEDAEYVANKLVQSAINEAGRDNVTVAVIDVLPSDADQTGPINIIDQDLTEDISYAQAISTDPQAFATEDRAPHDADPHDQTTEFNDINHVNDFEEVNEFDQNDFDQDALESFETEPANAEPFADDDIVLFDDLPGSIEADDAFDEDDVVAANGDPTSNSSNFDDETTSSSKRGTLILGVLTLLVAVVLGVAYVAYDQLAADTWFIDEVDGQVQVFQGHPSGRLWFSPTLVVDADIPPIEVANLAQENQRQVEENTQFASQLEAEQYIQSLTPTADLSQEINQTQDATDDPASSRRTARRDETATTVATTSTTTVPTTVESTSET